MVFVSNWFTVISTILSVIVSLIMIILIIREKPSKGQMYFVLTIAFTFVFSICAYLEETASEQNSIVNAIKLGNVSKIMLITYSVFFFAEYYHISIKRWVNGLLWSIDLFLICTVFAFPKCKLFYTEITMAYIGRMPHVKKEYGFAFYVMIAETYSILITTVIFMIIRWIKAQNVIQKRRYFFMLLGILSPTIGIALQILGIWRGYDLLAFCFMITGLFFIVSIRKYHMFDIEQNAKEYILDNADEAVVIMNTRREVIYYNKPFTKLFSKVRIYKRLDAVSDISKEERKLSNGLDKLFEQCSNSDSNQIQMPEIEFEYGEKTYNMNLTNLYRKNGSVLGYLLELQDLTEKKKDLLRIEDLTKEADRANKTKSSFLANMSHEIRTPINAILGMDEMIIREGKEKNVSEYANNIKAAGNTLLALVNDILDFSKLESGKMDLLENSYDVSEMIESIFQKIQIRKHETKVELQPEIDPEFPKKMYGDQLRVEQLIVNIFLSGMKFCKREKLEARVSLELTDDLYESYPLAMLHIRFRETGKIVRFQEVDLNKLNKKQCEEEEKIEIGNNQLELTLAMIDQLLVILHGSKNVSENDIETIVELTIPQGIVNQTPIGIIDFSQYRSIDTQDEEIYENPNARILVVDDNAVNLKVMQGLLRRTKVQVSCARSGRECIKKVCEESFDLIFMDHLMPEMDGIETLHYLKKEEDNLCKDTPVIALTANVIQGAREMYMKEGFQDYLMKPVDGNSLENILKNYLS